VVLADDGPADALSLAAEGVLAHQQAPFLCSALGDLVW
jgi:hypothetical protein